MSDRPPEVIDCDVHCETPTATELAPYLEVFWRDYLNDGRFSVPSALNTMYPPKAPTTSTLVGPNTPALLAAHLDSEGARQAVINCIYGLEGLRNPDLANSLARAVNDWVAEHWLSTDERLTAGILVSVEDPAGAAAEIERRAGDPRFVHVLLPGRGRIPFGDAFYWPLVEAAQAHGLPVALHFGGASGIAPTAVGWPAHYFEEYVGVSQVLQAQVISFIAGQTLVRYPQLRIVILEGGFTWFPPLMWRLDKEWKGMFRREIPWLKTRPSELIRTHFRAALQPIDGPADPDLLARVVEQIGGSDFLLFSSDFPHRHVHTFDEAFAGRLPDDVERRIRVDAAAALYSERAALSGAAK